VDPILAMSATEKGAVLLAISGIAAPIAGYLFHRSAQSWGSFGQGPLSINAETPVAPSRPGSPSSPADRAVQAAEVRQMLEAKSERRRRRGEAPLDVEAETRRLLAAAERPRGEEGMNEELRAEVRQLVVARNDRRVRQGLEPLDVEAETQRQLDDLVGSN
jgi:hypothetical protein